MRDEDKRALVELTNNLTVAYPSRISSEILEQTLRKGYLTSYRGPFGSVWVNRDVADTPENKARLRQIVANNQKLFAAFQSGANVHEMARITSVLVETMRRFLFLGECLGLWTIAVDAFVTHVE